ncbi:hypothetical protein [Capnocytophaga ochracea]|nr:hypothetical protein [Capnocytophaga ochracea]EJF45402.1 hypothetical protein HMPREF1319_0896 [Capnocytophaga ochracea str. Holt 25]UEB43586.1 hypothetical protein LK419_01015 [Capnocytophaga ochracea]
MKIHSLYGKKVKELYEQWWDKISTSKNITKYSKELEAYRQSLQPGDIALLGCLTEGGQGLATANNGKYIAIRKSTKWAKNILESRPKKLLEVVKRYKTAVKVANEEEAKDYLAALSEEQIAILFDELKEKFGRDIFGQGYIYRLIEDDEMADVETLTQDEKDNGILLNSYFIFHYKRNFINSSSAAFQINDARQISIIIPTEKELKEFEELFNWAFEIKKTITDEKISLDNLEMQLLEIQEKLDTIVNELYSI